MKAGKLITIEGSEGAGKSTALHVIHDYLAKHHIDAITTREPGGTKLAEDIRQLLLYPASVEPVYPETELLLMFAGRAQHIKQCIQPALNAGKWVISDRYIDASYAYQGGGRGIDERLIKNLDKWIVKSCYPDLTFLMDIPIEIGLERTVTRGGQKDRIEQEALSFFMRVRAAYLARALEDPVRIKIIDAEQSLTAIKDQLHHEIDEFLKRSA